MLVLTRYEGEAIRISDNIIVKPLGWHGKQFKIGIEAPKTITIHREEVYQRAILSGDIEDARATRAKHITVIRLAALDYADDDPEFTTMLNAAADFMEGSHC